MYKDIQKKPKCKTIKSLLALFLSLPVLLGSVIPFFNYLMIRVSAWDVTIYDENEIYGMSPILKTGRFFYKMPVLEHGR